jgi:hypothetical protein
VIIGQLPQGPDLVEDHRQVLQVKGEGAGWVGMAGAGLVVDATIHALKHKQAKRMHCL